MQRNKIKKVACDLRKITNVNFVAIEQRFCSF